MKFAATVNCPSEPGPLTMKSPLFSMFELGVGPKTVRVEPLPAVQVVAPLFSRVELSFKEVLLISRSAPESTSRVTLDAKVLSSHVEPVPLRLSV